MICQQNNRNNYNTYSVIYCFEYLLNTYDLLLDRNNEYNN